MAYNYFQLFLLTGLFWFQNIWRKFILVVADFKIAFIVQVVGQQSFPPISP